MTPSRTSGERHRTPASLGRPRAASSPPSYGAGTSCRAGEAAQHVHREHGQHRVDRHHRVEAEEQPRRRAHRVRGAQVPVDDPRLAADLRGDPAGLQRGHGGDPRDRHGPEEPPVLDPGAPLPHREAVHEREQQQRRAGTDHRVVGQVHDVDRRPVLLGGLLQAGHHAVRVVVDQQREAVGDLQGVVQLVVVVDAAERQRRLALRLVLRLHRGELGRLQLRDGVGDPVADPDLDRREDRPDGQRDEHAHPVVAVPVPAVPVAPRPRSMPTA